MITIENVSRRGFLQGMFSAGAFVLCARILPEPLWAATTGAPGSVDATAFHPSIFVGIHTDGTVYIMAHRSEMGNGVRTSLPRILADELDADWARDSFAPVPTFVDTGSALVDKTNVDAFIAASKSIWPAVADLIFP